MLPVLKLTAAAVLVSTAMAATPATAQSREVCETFRGSGYGLTQRSALVAARKQAYAQADVFLAGHRTHTAGDFKEECGNSLVMHACSFSVKSCKIFRSGRSR